MDFRRLGTSIAVSLALYLALPAAAQDSSAPATLSAPVAVRGELEKERTLEMWSIALIGPAAMIFVVTALGLTITVRSLREDFRHQRTLNQYWRHGAMSRAKIGRD
jgi:integral membrane sensor domain MASE1